MYRATDRHEKNSGGFYDTRIFHPYAKKFPYILASMYLFNVYWKYTEYIVLRYYNALSNT